MGRGAWWATVHGVTRSQTQLSDYQFSLSMQQDHMKDQLDVYPCPKQGG